MCASAPSMSAEEFGASGSGSTAYGAARAQKECESSYKGKWAPCGA